MLVGAAYSPLCRQGDGAQLEDRIVSRGVSLFVGIVIGLVMGAVLGFIGAKQYMEPAKPSLDGSVAPPKPLPASSTVAKAPATAVVAARPPQPKPPVPRPPKPKPPAGPPSREVARKGFRLKYPAAWSLDAASAGYDPDHKFSIDGPNATFVMVTLIDGAIDLDKKLAAETAGVVPQLIAKPQRTPFATWGKHQGKGVRLGGNIMNAGEGAIRIFACTAGGRSFTIVESCFDRSREQVGPGLKLIESSFELLQ